MSINTLVEHKELDFARAAEIRNPNGGRRYASVDTIRRRHRRDLLPAEYRDGKYYARVVDLEALFVKDSESPQEWAVRIAATAPPMTDDQAARVVTILRGGAPA